MITMIGIVAGEIWHYLEEHKEAKLSDLSEKLEKSRDSILMAVGWLSREGHVVLSGDESDYKITFRKKADSK